MRLIIPLMEKLMHTAFPQEERRDTVQQRKNYLIIIPGSATTLF